MPVAAQGGGGGIVCTHSQPSTWTRWVVSTMLWPLYPMERTSIHWTGGCVGLGASLDSRENLALTRIWFPDHPAHNRLLYQLWHLVAHCVRTCRKFFCPAIKVKVICGSYSTAALWHIVLFPKRVPSFISRGAAHTTSASEGRKELYLEFS
jgi:hypothetical protein